MTDEKYEIRQYNRRWVNLFLFAIYAVNNGLHWVQYSVINDKVSQYYSVPHAYVEWTSGMYTLSYVLFVAPGLYLLEKLKMKNTMIVASSISTIGAWMKVWSVVPDRFFLAFISQMLLATSYTFTFGVSACLAATWFGVHESSRASALALFGDQFGGCISFLLPVLMIKKTSSTSIFEEDLKRMHVTNAVLSTVVCALIILMFKEKPKTPPSKAQAQKTKFPDETFMESFPKIMKNRPFLQFLGAYGILCGTMVTVGTVFGEIIAYNFPDKPEHAGKVGFIFIAVGMFSSPVFSFILDKTGYFKKIGLFLFTGSFVSFLIFVFVLKMNSITYIYVASIFLGAFLLGTYVNGIQIGIEMLYPIPEGRCSSIMIFVMQMIGFILLPIYSTLLRHYGDISANILFCVLLLSRSIIFIFTPVKLNRRETEHVLNKEGLNGYSLTAEL